MTKTQVMKNAPEIDTSQLQKIYATLHLAFHRNKNQHGRCAWWKWLSILRRTVLKLFNAAERQQQPQRRDAIAGTIKNLAAHLNEHVIPRCYLAFSTVVADNQFAALGTVLIATLAQLQRLIAPIAPRSMPTERKADNVTRLEGPVPRKAEEEDLGEVVGRDAVFPEKVEEKEKKAAISEKVPSESITSREKSADTSAKEEAPPRKKNKTKKKTKKNAIDELFDALG